ncbi:MAG: hypothetical protein SGI92_00970 [Bryobacteraceae bacterium]|nr:hypothetical protein [Bryobacteraceae bacterium]
MMQNKPEPRLVPKPLQQNKPGPDPSETGPKAPERIPPAPKAA